MWRSSCIDNTDRQRPARLSVRLE